MLSPLCLVPTTINIKYPGKSLMKTKHNYSGIFPFNWKNLLNGSSYFLWIQKFDKLNFKKNRCFWEFGVGIHSISSILRKVCCLHTLIVRRVIGMNEIIQCFGGSFLPWTGWHDPFLNTNTLSHCITRRFACVHTYLPRVCDKIFWLLFLDKLIPFYPNAQLTF